MKKILSILLLFTSLYSEATLYFGTNYGVVNEKFTNNKGTKSASQSLNINFGYGDINAYAINFGVDIIKSKESTISNKDGKQYNFNIDLIKAFNFDIFMNPFFQAGFGMGNMKVASSTQNSLGYGSLNLGAGIFIPINHYFNIEIGYKYKYLSYERFEEKSYKSHQNTIYSGVSFRY